MLFGKLFTNPKMWVNGDADEIKMGGVYTCKDVQNVPTGDGALFVFKTEDTVKQVFVPVGEEGVVYTRVIGEEWGRVTGTSEETEALIQSAIDKANQAQAKADLVDTKLDNIIIESGTSDAEVVAARTDSNGQTFTTLGVRLDTQFGEIKEDLSDLTKRDIISSPISGLTMQYNKLVTSDGSYYSYTIGQAVEIDVTKYVMIEFPASSFTSEYGYIWKAEDNTFFGFVKTTEKTILTVKVPENAVALRTCWRKADYADTTGLFKGYRTMGELAYERTDFPWLNRIENDIANSAWSWWNYPQIVTEPNIRNRAYFGEVSTCGVAGIGSVSLIDGKDGRKTNTIMVGQDDHNAMTVFKNSISASGRYFLAFAFSHNENKYIHNFVAKVGNNAEYYNEPIEIEFPGQVSYAQVFSTNKSTTDYSMNRVFLITRVNNNSWYGVMSNTSFGNSWGTPQPIITADRQYYCMFRETTTAGVLRIVMYSNPNLTRTDTRIRMGFLHLEDGNIYNADNSTLLGNISTGGVPYRNFDIIISIPNYDESQTEDTQNEIRNRLLDVAITAPNTSYIAYARFTNYSDAEYYVYYNGTTKNIVAAGDAFYRASVYVGGLIFTPKNPNTIYLSRKESSRSRLEKWVYSNDEYTFDTEIDSGDNDLVWCVRPIIDNDGTVVIYQKGGCNVNNFSQYNFDAKAYKVI